MPTDETLRALDARFGADPMRAEILRLRHALELLWDAEPETYGTCTCDKHNCTVEREVRAAVLAALGRPDIFCAGCNLDVPSGINEERFCASCALARQEER